MTNKHVQKTALRAEIRAVLKNTSSEVFVKAGTVVKATFVEWLNQQTENSYFKLGCFNNFKDEIDTNPLNEFLQNSQLDCYFPEVTPSMNLEFFNKQKKQTELEHLDILFMPGIAFDLKGARLGRGKGCYDRFLAPISSLSQKPLLVALALDCQIKDRIPTEAHDISMDYLCTPKLGMLRIKKRENS